MSTTLRELCLDTELMILYMLGEKNLLRRHFGVDGITVS